MKDKSTDNLPLKHVPFTSLEKQGSKNGFERFFRPEKKKDLNPYLINSFQLVILQLIHSWPCSPKDH